MQGISVHSMPGESRRNAAGKIGCTGLGKRNSLIYKENEIIIVDFKTDTVNNEQELIELYTIQLQTYKQAMKKITDLPIKTYIYSFSLSKYIYLE